MKGTAVAAPGRFPFRRKCGDWVEEGELRTRQRDSIRFLETAERKATERLSPQRGCGAGPSAPCTPTSTIAVWGEWRPHGVVDSLSPVLYLHPERGLPGTLKFSLLSPFGPCWRDSHLLTPDTFKIVQMETMLQISPFNERWCQPLSANLPLTKSHLYLEVTETPVPAGQRLRVLLPPLRVSLVLHRRSHEENRAGNSHSDLSLPWCPE